MGDKLLDVRVRAVDMRQQLDAFGISRPASSRRSAKESEIAAAYVSRRTKMTMKAIAWLITDRLPSESRAEPDPNRP